MDRAFDAALSFFDKLNVIKYSSVLPEVVFVDSQIPLNNLSDLVQEGYLLRQERETGCDFASKALSWLISSTEPASILRKVSLSLESC